MSTLQERDFSSARRQKMAGEGHALPDGSFPIANAGDLANAIRLAGKASDPSKARAHIVARAKALGLESRLPDSWKTQEGWDSSEQRRRAVALHHESVLEAGQFDPRLHLRNRRGEFADMPGGHVKTSLLKGTQAAPVGYEGQHEGRTFKSLYPKLYRVQHRAQVGNRQYDVNKVIGALDEHHARAQAGTSHGSSIRGPVKVTHVATLQPRTRPAERQGQMSLLDPQTAHQFRYSSGDRSAAATRRVVRSMDRRYHAQQKAKEKKLKRAAATPDPNEAGWVKALRRQGAAAGTAPQTVQSVPAPGRDRPYGGQSREQYQRERDKILTQDERRIRELEKQGLDRFGRPHTAQSVPAAPAIAPEALRSMPLYALASIIQDDWKKPYFGAVPYLQALSALKSHDDNYGADSGRSIVAYFLSNATTWRGPVAKAVKAELKRRTGRR